MKRLLMLVVALGACCDTGTRTDTAAATGSGSGGAPVLVDAAPPACTCLVGLVCPDGAPPEAYSCPDGG